MLPMDPRALNRLVQCVKENRELLLQYDAERRQLMIYPWPLDEKLVPVNMKDFIDQQKSRGFAFPGCFCPALSGSSENIQSAIFVAPDEAYEKRYIAACSTHTCEYIDLPVKMYFRPGHPTQYYPRRASTNPVLQPFNPSADIPEQQNLANRTTAHEEERQKYSDALQFAELFFPPSPRIDATTPSLLYRLHSTHRPGLFQRDFHNLFLRCECGIVSTNRKNSFHKCQTSLSAQVQDVSLLTDVDFLRLLYRLDAGIRLDDFAQMFARCTCGLVMTKRRFTIHECLRIP